MTGLLIALLALLPIQVAERLTVEEPILGELTSDDHAVHTETLDGEGFSSGPAVGIGFVLEVDETGIYTIELRSYFFDAYLVLRDAEGNVLGEDDDGLIRTQARLVAELVAGQTYRIDACALNGEPGRFELSLRSGEASLDVLDAKRDDAERRVRALQAVLGPDHRDVAAARIQLGYALHGLGETAAAIPLIERGSAILDEVDGETLELASAMNALGVMHASLGNLAAAQPFYERALAIEEIHQGPEHPDLATPLSNFALLLIDLGEFSRARLLLERALAIREESLGPEHADVGRTLRSLADVHFKLGDPSNARALFERALAILEKALGPENSTTAICLNDLGVLLRSEGDLAASRRYLERGLAILEKVLGPVHLQTATALLNLAKTLREGNEFEAARPLAERAVAILEEHWSGKRRKLAVALVALSGLLVNEGELAGAREHLERARAIFEEVVGLENPETAEVLHTLARILRQQGDFGAAREELERANAIRERVLGPDHPDLARGLSLLADLLGDLGDRVAARVLDERALAILEKTLGPEHIFTAATLNSMAVLDLEVGDYASARSLFERTLVVFERTYGPNHSTTAKGMANLAVALQKLGDFESARELTERSLAIMEEVLGPDHLETASTASKLAHQLDDLGEYERARELLERALAIRERVLGAEHPAVIKALTSLAQNLFVVGETDAAWETISRAARARRGQVHLVLQELSEAESYQYVSELRWQLEVQLSVGSALDEPGAEAQSYRGLIEWKGRIARVLVASREQLARELDDGQAALVEELRGAQARLSRLFSEQPPGSAQARAEREKRVGELREERNALELSLKRSLEATDSEPIPTASELGGALPPRSAVVDLFVHSAYEPAAFEQGELVRTGHWSGDRVSAWIVLAGESEVARVDLGPAGPIEEAVREHLGSLVAEGPARGKLLSAERSTVGGAGMSLRRLLWDSLAEHLDGVETVFVSPDSFLGTLPLETLPLDDGTFLLEHVAFVYQQDVASLARAGASPITNRSSLLAMGAVDFGERAESSVVAAAGVRSNDALRGGFGVEWAYLPATASESRSVASLHGEAHGEDGERLLLQGADATEERLKYELPRHTVLHLATHGFFQPEGTPSKWESALSERGQQEMRMSDEASHLVGKHPGLLSGLVCAGANRPPEGEGDDGYLTAEEVGWLDLSNVELVVMSACETGLGRAESGEGLIGLRRAFRTAGAKTVVSSLWSVGDESTAELMRDFYVNLWTKGMGRLEALRAAQLAMLRKNRMEHGEAMPSTWGAFVLSGEWR